MSINARAANRRPLRKPIAMHAPVGGIIARMVNLEAEREGDGRSKCCGYRICARIPGKCIPVQPYTGSFYWMLDQVNLGKMVRSTSGAQFQMVGGEIVFKPTSAGQPAWVAITRASLDADPYWKEARYELVPEAKPVAKKNPAADVGSYTWACAQLEAGKTVRTLAGAGIADGDIGTMWRNTPSGVEIGRLSGPNPFGRCVPNAGVMTISKSWDRYRFEVVE